MDYSLATILIATLTQCSRIDKEQRQTVHELYEQTYTEESTMSSIYLLLNLTSNPPVFKYISNHQK